MPDTTYDLVGIGNAIVDIVASVDEPFLASHGMRKGGMALIDEARAELLTRALPGGVRVSGGSVANSCVIAACLGASTAYLGRVADDATGDAFRADICAAGVCFPSAAATGGRATARCLIAVTPDGQRTMNTFLGACADFGASDVDTDLIATSATLYLEGYLFDPPAAQEAFRLAARCARRAGRRVALSLSDAFCVDRHRDEFRDFLREGVDVLFANEAEICALFETRSFGEAAALAAAEAPLAVLTRGEAGSVICQDERRIAVPASPANVVDTTGAGDAYAAGFLAGMARGHDLAACGRMGGMAASDIIGVYGARPGKARPATALAETA